MKRFVGFGELLLSLSPCCYLRFIQANSFDLNYTGAEANVCVSLSAMGVKTDFVTRLPDNDIAKCGIASLRKYNVATEKIIYGGERMGVLYMEKGASQRPSKVIYDRKHTSIATADKSEFDWDNIFEGAGHFHFTGITAALSEKTPAICKEACIAAKKHGLTVSCDLNYRKNLWTQKQAQIVMEELLQYTDILIANEEDADKVLGIHAADTDVVAGRLNYDGYVDVARRICEKYGIKTVGITLRKSISASDNEWGAMLYTGGQAYFSKRYLIHIVNRVGGGDSFSAGLIYALGNKFEPQKAIDFAAAASCLKHTIELDFNLSTVPEIERLISGDGSGRVQR